MRKLFLLPAVLFSFAVLAQKKTDKPKPGQKPAPTQQQQQPQQKPTKKYPSLLWEISGNGLKQPSYLFGTMHVSNKLAFHLGDSFFIALKNVEVVALEQDPDLWQEEYSKQPEYNDFNFYLNNFGSYFGGNDHLTQKTFAFKDYKEKLKAALSLEAKMVNGMMYRRSPLLEDFQEDTYLDMYIYQAGKKLNKIVTGVENYKETNKLVMQAYKALMRDRYSKRKSYNYKNYLTEGKTREDAYRSGNLDLIDSLEQSDIISEEYQEKFMYKRNEIQAHSIDTILKKHSLFVGVGAAHLPGSRGVIELLRKKGYKVRPIIMGERNGQEKEKLEKIRVPVAFSDHWMEDSAFTVSAPGAKFFRYPSYGGLNMIQYADMANGSYYMITRIRTNASFMGHNQQFVMNKVDSMLYENIPGKILEKKKMTLQGYPALEITNRTKKGDVQRYNIIVLPDEVVILKIAGVGEYVAETKEAGKFLSSLNFKTATAATAKYEPPYKGFAVQFPKPPFYLSNVRNDRDRNEWTATDDAGNSYLVMKTNLNQFQFIEEDTFDLALVEESFISSNFVGKKLDRQFSKVDGFPALDAVYEHSDGTRIKTKYVLRGNDYFVLAAKTKKPESVQSFFDSFHFTPYEYGEVKPRKDTVIGFTVRSSVFYPEKDTTEEDLDLNIYSMYRVTEDDDDDDNETYYHTQTIGNDTTGEFIYLSRYTVPEFYYTKDTAEFFEENVYGHSTDTFSLITYRKKEYTDSRNWKVIEYELRDTASSRNIMGKNFYKNGTSFKLTSSGDTLHHPGSFIQTFFETFEPADTFKARDPFAKKTEQFFKDYFGTDTVKAKRAKRLIGYAGLDSSDLPNVKKAITSLNWKTKKYLQTKQDWIGVMSNFKDSATVQYLAELYDNVKDTIDLQNTILNVLLDSRTEYALQTFKDLLLKEPPVILDEDYDYGGFRRRSYDVSFGSFVYRSHYNGSDDDWDQLYDTLKLSSKIIPDLVNLMVVEDYKPKVMKLLVTAIDSGYLEGKAYKEYFSKFLLEGKQILKKQMAQESQDAIEKESLKDDRAYQMYHYDDEEEEGQGNDELIEYGTLLLPFYEESQEVRNYFARLMTTTDRRLLFDASLLLLRHKKPVADSLILSLAAKDNYRLLLYNALEEAKLLDKFPAKYRNQSDITRALIIDHSKLDSLVFLKKELYTEKDRKGWIYFYKYKEMKDDEKWKIAVTGVQPFDLDSVKVWDARDSRGYNDDYFYIRRYYQFDGFNVSKYILDDVFCELTDDYYDETKDLSAVMAKIIKEKKYEKRASTARFFDGKDNDVYDVYLPDRVRADRFDFLK